MVVEEKAADRFIFELLKNGVYYVKNEEEIQKLLDAAVTGDFVINKNWKVGAPMKFLNMQVFPVMEPSN